MKRTGYIRDTGMKGRVERQSVLLGEAGCDAILIEDYSMDSDNLPELNGFLTSASEHDCLVTCDMSSLSRSMKVVTKTMQTLRIKNAELEILDFPCDPLSEEGQNIVDRIAAKIRDLPN